MTTNSDKPAAQPGTPDPSFGSEGSTTLQMLIDSKRFGITYLAKGLAEDSQQKTLFSAHLFHLESGQHVYGLGRLNKKGYLDFTFAEKGLTYGNFVANSGSTGGKIAVQKIENGNIYMLGESTGSDNWAELAVACFDHTGKPSSDFGDNAHVIIPTPPDYELLVDRSSLIVQADNKLLIAPYYISRTGDRPVTAVLWRLLSDGQPDKDFGVNGRWEFKLPDSPTTPTAIRAMLNQGQNILIAGHAELRVQKRSAVVARLTPDGKFDDNFGGARKKGVHIVEMTDHTTGFNALTEQSDGTLICAGEAIATSQSKTAGLLVALTPNGVPHRLFNNTKPLVTRFDENNDNGWVSVVRQLDNRFVTASQGSLVAIARFEPNGELDKTFNGKGYTDLGSGSRGPVLLISDELGRNIVSANVLGTSHEGIGLFKRFL